MQKLSIIICSTRPGRVGESVANWFFEYAQKNGEFDAQLIDLKVVDLPFLDEPHHPAQGKYTKEHTRRWSETVDASDAFVFVTPEYNYSSPATLINAFDFLYREWNYKPCAFVSYGGISGGMRSVQDTKLIATTLKMMPILEAVTIPFVNNQIEDGEFKSSEINEKAAKSLLDELFKWSSALKTMRPAKANK